MLQLRPNCECCDKDLPPDSDEVMICSFECTFCSTCMTEFFNNKCPNCDGESVKRPTRIGESLARNPASEKRILSQYDITIIKGKKTINRTIISKD